MQKGGRTNTYEPPLYADKRPFLGPSIHPYWRKNYKYGKEHSKYPVRKQFEVIK